MKFLDKQGIVIFCRTCDVNAFKRLDEVFLRNGPNPDTYYEDLRKKVKFFVLECRYISFSNCINKVSVLTGEVDES